jgi:inosose dehydratase
MGAMTEPPGGVPEYPPLLAAVEELGLDVFAIVEHDLYPCAPDVPRPIAERTHRYIASCGIPSLEIGVPRAGAARAEGGA